MGIRQDQCNKVCRIIDDYLANRPRERDELIVAVRTVFKEADRKTESNSEIPNNFDKDINVRSKDEPQTDIGIGCSRCGVRFGCIDRGMPHAVYCNSYGKITDEPQERSRR